MARQRVQEVARRDRCARFTVLLRHISPELLRARFYVFKGMAASGIDGVTWNQHEVAFTLRCQTPERRSIAALKRANINHRGRRVDKKSQAQRPCNRSQPALPGDVSGDERLLRRIFARIGWRLCGFGGAYQGCFVVS